MVILSITTFFIYSPKPYVIAHTGHIQEIARITAQKGTVTSFSATLDYTPEAEHRIKEFKKIFGAFRVIEDYLESQLQAGEIKDS